MQEVRGRDCPFKNASGEQIPPGALLVPGAMIEDTGAVRVTKPTAASMPGLLVNGPFTVDIDGEGVGVWGPQVELGYDPAGLEEDDPAAGTYGSEAGAWFAKPGNYGFVVFGTSKADFGLVNAVRDGTGSPTPVPPPPPPPPPTVGDCGWVAEMVNWTSVFFSVVSKGGMCDCIDLDQKVLLVQTSLGVFTSITEGPFDDYFTSCVEQYKVRLITTGCGPPCIELTQRVGGSGGPQTYRLNFAYCVPGTREIVFAGSGVRYCDGDPSPCQNVDDTFRVKVACAVVCLCEDHYPVPAVLHATFMGGDMTACLADGQTYTLPYTGGPPPSPGSEQWQYASAPMTGCGPFTGCQPGFLSTGVAVDVVFCPPAAFFASFIATLSFEGGVAHCPNFQMKEVPGTRVLQCNPLMVTFDIELDGTPDAETMALIATMGTTLPDKVVITA